MVNCFVDKFLSGFKKSYSFRKFFSLIEKFTNYKKHKFIPEILVEYLVFNSLEYFLLIISKTFTRKSSSF